jgi:hypothetical protein
MGCNLTRQLPTESRAAHSSYLQRNARALTGKELEARRAGSGGCKRSAAPTVMTGDDEGHAREEARGKELAAGCGGFELKSGNAFSG